MVLRRIGVVSLGKFMGLLYGLVGLLIGGVVSLLAMLGAAAGRQQEQQQGAAGVLFGIGIAAIIVLPLLYGFFGFLGGRISGALFNLVASLAGGIELEFSDGEKTLRPRSEPFSDEPFRP
jgi:hypothetical protein